MNNLVGMPVFGDGDFDFEEQEIQNEACAVRLAEDEAGRNPGCLQNKLPSVAKGGNWPMDSLIRAASKQGYNMEELREEEAVTAKWDEGYMVWRPNHYTCLKALDGQLWHLDSLGPTPTSPVHATCKSSMLRMLCGKADGRIFRFCRGSVEAKKMELAQGGNHQSGTSLEDGGHADEDWSMATPVDGQSQWAMAKQRRALRMDATLATAHCHFLGAAQARLWMT